MKLNINLSLFKSEINTLIVQKNIKNLQLSGCKINTLILEDYGLENLEITSINRIIVKENTIFDKINSSYQIDLSKFYNLKEIKLSEIKSLNHYFPHQLQLLHIENRLERTAQELDFSYLNQLQNLKISDFVLKSLITCQGRLLISCKNYDKSHRVDIQVKNILCGKFQFYDYLENIEKIEFYGIQHIKIKGQPDNTIDGHVFKSLKYIKIGCSENIKIINCSNLNLNE